MNSNKGLFKVFTVVTVCLALVLAAPISSHAALLPNWVISKVLNTFTGSVYDEVGGFFTREGLSLAQVDQVKMDAAQSFYAYVYDDKLGHFGLTQQGSYNGGQQSYGYGSELMDRKFSYHDWLYYDQYDELGEASPTISVSGKGMITPPLDDTDFVQFGTLRSWNAKYVVTSTYSNPTGDQGLRKNPKDYLAEVEYFLNDLDYSHNTGISSVPRYESQKRAVMLDSVASSQAQVDLLENNTELNGRAYAYGSCTRVWRLKIPSWNLWDVLTTQRDQLLTKFISECEWVIDEKTVH